MTFNMGPDYPLFGSGASPIEPGQSSGYTDIVTQQISDQIDGTRSLLCAKLGGSHRTLAAALRVHKRHLPHAVKRDLALLAKAETVVHHPKLAQTLDWPALQGAADRAQAHLKGIDLADRRKGWWLGMLGGLAFNLLLFATLCLIALKGLGVI